MDQHDKHVQEIYTKILVKRDQPLTELEQRRIETTSEYLAFMMKGILSKTMRLVQLREISKKQIDDTQREVSKLFDYVLMHTDPEVIQTLVYEASKVKMMEKMKNE